MKKIIIGAIVLLLLFSVIGGGGKKDSSSNETASKKEVAVEETKKEEAAPVDADEGQEDAEQEETDEAEEEPVEEEPAEPEIEYEEVTVAEMFEDLEGNALKAKEKYEGKYLEITGLLNTIDSGGDYIALYPEEYSFSSVSCYIKNDEQKNQVANMSSGDTVTLRGKCTSVGEVMGYSLDIDSIDGYEEGEELDFDTTDDGYIIVSANELVELIGENPLKARNGLKGKNIELTGKLGTIDSSGKYIGIDSDDEWSFVNIQCFIKNDEQKSQVMDMTSGDTVTIRGKCKDVGEVLGFTIDIESIE